MSSAPTQSHRPFRRLARRPGWAAINFREVWQYREVLYFQAMRDIKVRYKQTALGAAWAVVQPVTTMLIFSLFFGKLMKIGSQDVPYPLWVFAALLPWKLFEFALTQSSNSLVDNAHLITKVYFPRLIVPLASVSAGLVDFAVSFSVLLGMMAWFGRWPGWQAAAVVPLVGLAMLAALAAGLWLSALNVRYRDIRYTLPFLTQVLFFVTPIVYPPDVLAERWRLIYGLNPMAGIVAGFRWALVGAPPPGPMMIVSVVATLLLFVGGLFYFRRMESRFADVV